MHAAWIVALAAGLAIACAHWPVSVYAFSLALFGVPHALVELRWVARRYGARRTVAARVLPVLLLVALGRLLAFPLGWSTGISTTVELALGAGLVLCVLVPARAAAAPGPGAPRAVGGVLVLALLAVGIVLAPVDAMLVLAILHNATPLGLVADRLRDGDSSPSARAGFAFAGGVAFVAVPLALASGAVTSVFSLPATSSTDSDLAGANGLGLVLHDGLAAFTPSFVPASRALDLLRAAAFLQVVHYVAVLLVLPLLGPAPARRPSKSSPPAPRAFAVLAVGLGLVFATGFVVDFREAKASYAVLAAVHVWLEFPALLLALGPRAPAPRLA